MYLDPKTSIERVLYSVCTIGKTGKRSVRIVLCTSICYIGMPTLKLIQAARTKDFLLAGIAGYHCRKANTYRTSAVGTEEEEKANTNSLRGGWNEKSTDRNYAKKRS